jgi:hypothetical protein
MAHTTSPAQTNRAPNPTYPELTTRILSGTQRARRKVGGRQAQPDVAATNAAATSATVLRIPSVVIFAIFRKQAFFVTFIGVSFAVASCWSSWLKPLIMMLQPNATRSSNAGPGNAGLNLPTVRSCYQAGSARPRHTVRGSLTLALRL